MNNKMIAKRREKILQYNSKQCCDPLEFKDQYDIRGDSIPITEDQLKFNRDGSPNRKQLVRIILEMAREYGSYNPTTKSLETGCGRNRSSLDIWRHVKSLYPDMDVFLIMEAIHALSMDDREEIYGQYCNYVKRSVFSLDGPREYIYWKCNEYKISFNTWRKLHEEVE